MWEIVTILCLLILRCSAETTAARVRGLQTAQELFECKANLAQSDKDRDTEMSRGEYHSYVIDISGNATFAVTERFNQLPRVIKDNFFDLAVGNTIDIVGARSDESNPDSDIILWNICNSIEIAVQLAVTDTSDRAPTSSPAPSTSDTNAPTSSVNLVQCYAKLGQSSTKDGDLFMSQEEYIVFIRRFGKTKVWKDAAFEELPTVLQENFNSLAGDNGTIPIAGFRGDGGKEQTAFLNKVCIQTSQAIAEALLSSSPPPLIPTISPTVTLNPTSPLEPTFLPETIAPTASPSMLTPTTEAPTTPGSSPSGTTTPTTEETTAEPSAGPMDTSAPTAVSTVAPSASVTMGGGSLLNVSVPFTISNSLNLSASDLVDIVPDLESAYEATAKEVVASLAPQRRRRLQETLTDLQFVNASIGTMVDVECATSCQEFPNAQLSVLAAVENATAISDNIFQRQGTNLEEIVVLLETQMRQAIANGTLQSNLEAINPSTPVQVQDETTLTPTVAPSVSSTSAGTTSEPTLVGTTSAPNVPTTTAPSASPPSSSSDSGLSTGALVGIALAGVGGALLFALACRIYMKKRAAATALANTDKYNQVNGSNHSPDLFQPNDPDEYDSVGWSKPEVIHRNPGPSASRLDEDTIAMDSVMMDAGPPPEPDFSSPPQEPPQPDFSSAKAPPDVSGYENVGQHQVAHEDRHTEGYSSRGESSYSSSGPGEALSDGDSSSFESSSSGSSYSSPRASAPDSDSDESSSSDDDAYSYGFRQGSFRREKG